MGMTIDKVAEKKALIKSTHKYLRFRLAREFYAIDVMRVQGIIRSQLISETPGYPDYIKGFVKLRGWVIPVQDLTYRFDMSSADSDETPCIIIVQTQTQNGDIKLSGLIVDAVDEIIELKPDEIGEAPLFGTRIPIDYIHGVSNINGSIYTILDIDKFTSEPVLDIGI
jgi:purine-binding chemotaxis protein CheW